jgi:hypothetical protein
MRSDNAPPKVRIYFLSHCCPAVQSNFTSQPPPLPGRVAQISGEVDSKMVPPPPYAQLWHPGTGGWRVERVDGNIERTYATGWDVGKGKFVMAQISIAFVTADFPARGSHWKVCGDGNVVDSGTAGFAQGNAKAVNPRTRLQTMPAYPWIQLGEIVFRYLKVVKRSGLPLTILRLRLEFRRT